MLFLHLILLGLWLIATVAMVIVAIKLMIKKKFIRLLKIFSLYCVFTCFPPTFTFVYAHLTVHDSAYILLGKVMEDKQKYFNKRIKEHKFDDEEKLKIKFKKEQKKFYESCKKAIEKKENNKNCEISFTIWFDIFLLSAVDVFVDIDYNFDKETYDFYSKITHKKRKINDYESFVMFYEVGYRKYAKFYMDI